ncbi:MAG: GAF domain-containing protein [Acidobacteria bacterium]|nr:GAF domain-containing protein [Acidobacteriota bacterium]
MADLRQSKSELLNQVMFQISNAVNTTYNINDLFVKIHAALNRLVDASIFYIALYDEETDTVSFPYYIDPVDRRYYVDKANQLGAEFSYVLGDTKGSMTGIVIRSGAPLLMTKDQLWAHCAETGSAPSGKPPEVWLGVPLIIRQQTIGVMAIQSYESVNAYSHEDKSILGMFSEQVALAIERKRNEDSLRDSESKYRNLVENIHDAVYSVDLNGMIRFISRQMERISGIPCHEFAGHWKRFSLEEESDARCFDELIHPDDRDHVRREIHQAILDKRSFQVEYRLHHGRKSYRWVLERGRFFHDEAGAYQLDGIITDIHLRKMSELDLRRQQALTAVLYGISSAIHLEGSLVDLCGAIGKVLSQVAVEDFALVLRSRHKGELEVVYSTHENASEWTSHLESCDSDQPVVLTDGWSAVGLPGKQAPLGWLLVRGRLEYDWAFFVPIAEQVALAVELKQTEQDLAATQLQLIENAHRSGMADIASATLHHVGNTLNSVNVAAGLVHEIMCRPFDKSIARVHEMVRPYLDDNDPKQASLLEAFAKLQTAIRQDRSNVTAQIAQMSDGVRLLQQTIHVQQQRTSRGFQEIEQPIQAIIEEAVSMYGSFFEQKAIKLHMMLEDCGGLSVPKFKFTYVLLELFKNICEALDEVSDSKRSLQIHLTQESGRMILVLSDTGPGIHDEARAQIFNVGYTTKPDRLGLGLHDVANALAEMGFEISTRPVEVGAQFVISGTINPR